MITFAEILQDKGYPGFDRVKHIDAPWVSDQFSLFRPEDEARFWFKGFQWPRAYPLNFVWLEDGFAWGTQAAAHNMPLPPSDGLAPRVAGIFVYGSDVPVPPWLIGNRAERVGAVLPPFLQNFPKIWNERRDEIFKSLRHFETADLVWKIAGRAVEIHGRRARLPRARVGNPLRSDVSAHRELSRLLRPVQGTRHRRRRHSEVSAGLRNPADEIGSGDVEAREQRARYARSQDHRRHGTGANLSDPAGRRRRRRSGSPISTRSCRSTVGAATASSTSVRRRGSKIRRAASASSNRCSRATIPTVSRKASRARSTSARR